MPFPHAEDMKKSAGGLQSTVSPPIGPEQSPGGGPRGEAPRSAAYLGFQNLLLYLKAGNLLLMIAQFMNYIAY